VFEQREERTGSMRGSPNLFDEHTLFSHSFLDFGVNRMMSRVDNVLYSYSLLQHQNSSASIKHPCLHSGFEDTSHGTQLGGAVFVGSSDFISCVRVIQEATGIDGLQRLGGITIPPLRGDFVATSAFYYVVNSINNFLPDVMGFPKPTLEELERSVSAMCSAPWRIVQEQFTDKDQHTDPGRPII
jgi:hypothetical protein